MVKKLLLITKKSYFQTPAWNVAAEANIVPES